MIPHFNNVLSLNKGRK